MYIAPCARLKHKTPYQHLSPTLAHTISGSGDTYRASHVRSVYFASVRETTASFETGLTFISLQ